MTLTAQAFSGALVMHMRLYMLRQSRIVTGLAMPIVIAAIAVLVLRHDAASPEKYFRVMIGSGMAGMWGAVLGTAMLTLRREREWYGTLPLLIATPARLEAIFGGYLLAEALAGFLAVVMSLSAGALLLDSPVQVTSPATLLVSLPLAALAIAAVALPIMPLVLQAPLLTRWINGMDYPVWILAGFLFPISILPGWTTPLSYALPAYWASEALQVVTVAPGGEVGTWERAAPLWLVTAVLCAVYVCVALLVQRLVVRRLHRTGVLIAE